MVTFGLTVSKAVTLVLLRMDVQQIFISFNNDFENNAGNRAAEEAKKQLLKHFDSEQVKVSLPFKNDFGDMIDSDFKTWESKYSSFDPQKQALQVLSYAEDLYKNKKISKAIYKNSKFISHLNG